MTAARGTLPSPPSLQSPFDSGHIRPSRLPHGEAVPSRVLPADLQSCLTHLPNSPLPPLKGTMWPWQRGNRLQCVLPVHALVDVSVLT